MLLKLCLWKEIFKQVISGTNEWNQPVLQLFA